MSITPNIEQKLNDLVKNWGKYSQMTCEEIGAKFGVSGRTIKTWREKLRIKGINLPFQRKSGYSSVFDKLAKK